MDQQYVSTPGMLVRGAKINLAKQLFEIEEKLPVGHNTPFHWCSVKRVPDGAQFWLQLLFNQFDNGQVTEFRQSWSERAKELAEHCISPVSVSFAVGHNIWAAGIFEPFRMEIPVGAEEVARSLFTALSKIHGAGYCIGGMSDESIGFRDGAAFCDLSTAPLIQYGDDRHLVPLRHKDFHVAPEVLDSRTPSRWGDIVALSSWLRARYPELADNKELVAVTSGAKFAEQWDAAALASLIKVAAPPPAVIPPAPVEEVETSVASESEADTELPEVAWRPAEEAPTGSFEEEATGAPEFAPQAEAPTQKPPVTAIPRPNVTAAPPVSPPVYASAESDIPLSLVVARGVIAAAVILLISWLLASWFVNGYVDPRMSVLQTERLSQQKRDAREKFQDRVRRARGE